MFKRRISIIGTTIRFGCSWVYRKKWNIGRDGVPMFPGYGTKERWGWVSQAALIIVIMASSTLSKTGRTAINCVRVIKS